MFAWLSIGGPPGRGRKALLTRFRRFLEELTTGKSPKMKDAKSDVLKKNTQKIDINSKY